MRPQHIRDIRPLVLDGDGRFRILPASFWKSTSVNERALFGHRTGIYAFPTVELVERLREIIAGRLAIEIGAGNGVLSQALGITATDSFQQTTEERQEIYQNNGFATVPYGPNVQKLDARQAVRVLRPKVVVACWVTHEFDRNKPWLSGNEGGVDEVDVLAHCEQYVFVGNSNPKTKHTSKPIWRVEHTVERHPYLFSRSRSPERDFIAVWQGSKGR